MFAGALLSAAILIACPGNEASGDGNVVGRRNCVEVARGIEANRCHGAGGAGSKGMTNQGPGDLDGTGTIEAALDGGDLFGA